ncbi:hypothetical protein E2C01_098878 [Portunus trituberculatus]|uniref:Uncharacterized protein n=1 Tax=Portunus trituberculatus TaxID=210409 RepID=A0A5B7JYV1_PORTR|nr:hypothetical protein [Portunus trituberculatus]
MAAVSERGDANYTKCGGRPGVLTHVDSRNTHSHFSSSISVIQSEKSWRILVYQNSKCGREPYSAAAPGPGTSVFKRLWDAVPVIAALWLLPYCAPLVCQCARVPPAHAAPVLVCAVCCAKEHQCSSGDCPPRSQ